MSKDNIKDFTPDVAARSYYLDFEGEGKKQDNKTPPLPHLAGVYRPKNGESKSQYIAQLYRSSWVPPHKSVNGPTELVNFQQGIEQLIDRAEKEGGYIVYWSCHEEDVIKTHVPNLAARFDARSINLLPELRRIKRRRKIEFNPAFDKDLNKYLDIFAPRFKKVVTPKLGAAELCRRIDKHCDSGLSYRKWPDKAKGYVKDLIGYNRQDCIATWRLAKYYANHLKAKYQ